MAYTPSQKQATAPTVPRRCNAAGDGDMLGETPFFSPAPQKNINREQQKNVLTNSRKSDKIRYPHTFRKNVRINKKRRSQR